YLQNSGERVLLIPGIDSLRRKADAKIFLPFHTRIFFQNRNTDFLCCARINGGFVYDNSSSFHMLSNSFTGADERCEIGLVGKIHWRWNCYHYIVSLRQFSRVGSNDEVT